MPVDFVYPWYVILINYIGLFLESLLLLVLLTGSFQFKKNIRHKNCVFAISVAISTLIFIVTGEMTHHSGNFIYYILFYFVGITYSLIVLDANTYVVFIEIINYFFSLMLSNTIVALFRILITNIIDPNTPPFPPYLMHTLADRILTKIPLAFIVCFLIVNTQREYHKVPKQYRIIYLLWSLAFILASQIPYLPGLFGDQNAQAVSNVINVFITVSSLLLIYYFFSSTVKQTNEKMKYYLENQQLSMEKEHIAEVEELYEDLRKLKHDLKNNIFVMDSLLVDKEYDKLHEYFKTLKEPLPELKLIDVGSPAINAILNAKVAAAHKLGIKLSVICRLPGELLIDDFDICSVIGNLCDNAIESSNIDSAEPVTIEISSVGIYLSIIVKNPISSDVITENPMLETSKEDSSLHGLGIGIIKSIAQKYDGMTLFTSKDGFFIASVQLKNIAVKSSAKPDF